MRSFRRTTAGGLPGDVAAHLALARGERVLVATALSGGRWAVATDRALLVVTADGLLERRGWELVDAAHWDAEAGALHVRWVDGGAPLVLAPDEPGALPEVVRERVQASLVLSQRVLARGRLGVLVAVRRVPADGSLVSQVVPDPGVRLDDPSTAARVERVHRDLRRQVGLPT